MSCYIDIFDCNVAFVHPESSLAKSYFDVSIRKIPTRLSLKICYSLQYCVILQEYKGFSVLICHYNLTGEYWENEEKHYTLYCCFEQPRYHTNENHV